MNRRLSEPDYPAAVGRQGQVRVLLAEDSDRDADLVRRALSRAGLRCEYRRVQSEAEFRRALEEFRPHIVLSDYAIPGFGAIPALRICRESGVDVPFIVVSGTIGEDVAVQAMKAGADDYVMKNNLTRLGPMVGRELQEAGVRRNARLAAVALARAQSMAKLAHVITDAEGNFESWSETLPRLLGRNAVQLPRSVRTWLPLIHPEDQTLFRETCVDAAKQGTRRSMAYRVQHADGGWVHINQVMEPIEDAVGAGGRWFNTMQDVSEQHESAEVLRTSEERLRAVFEQAAVGIVHTSLNGEVMMVNQKFCNLTGYTRSEAIQLHIRTLTHPEDVERGTEGRARMLRGKGEPYERDLRLLRKDGAEFWASITTSLIRAADGAPLHFISVVQDISERKKAARELDQFRQAMDASLDAIYLTDPSSLRFVYVNDTACRRLGHSRERLLQMGPQDAMPLSRDQVKREFEDVIAAGDAGTRAERPFVRSDGATGWTELNRKALRIDGETLIVTVARDISERKGAENSLRDSKQLLDNIVENIPTAVQLKSVADGYRVVLWNKAAEAMYGVPRQEAVGRNVHDLWPAADADRFHTADLELIASGQMQDFPDRPAQTRHRGEIRVHMRKVVLFDVEGNPTHLLAVADDITAQKRGEEELRRFRLALDNSPDLIIIIDRATMRHVDVNETACRLLGYSREELLRLGPADIVPVEGGALEKLYDELIAEPDRPSGMRSYYRCKDGSQLPFESTRKVLRSGDGWLIVAISRDIRSRLAAERAQQESDRRLRETFDLAGSGMAHVSLDGRFLRANRKLCDMLGYSEAELIGRSVKDISHPEDSGVTDEQRARMRTGELDSFGFEKRYLRKDGSVIWVSLTVALARNAAGEPEHEISVLDDITERRRAELLRALEHGVARELAGAASAGEGIVAVLRLVCESEGWLHGRYWRVDEAADLLRFGDAWADPALGEEVRHMSRELSFARGAGLAGRVWESREPLWVANVLEDSRVKNADLARTAGFRSAFLVPVRAGERTLGVMTFSSRESREPDRRLLATVRVIGSQLGQFLQRKAGEERVRKLNRVYAVLSGINALIVRARDRDELFREACRIVIEAGGLALTYICVVDAARQQLIPVVSAGAAAGFLDTVQSRNSLRDDAPEGHGPAARAVRERQAVVVSDVVTDPRIRHKQVHAERGIRSVAILPLVVADEPAGVLGLHAAEAGFFDGEEMRLLHELAANISLALDRFEKAERLKVEATERSLAEARVVRLNRVYAVLSGVDALIVRVRERSELFREACRIPVEVGGFPLAWIGIVDREAKRLEPVAWHGTGPDYTDYIGAMRLGIDDSVPEGRGMAGRAVRERKPVIANDIAHDPRITMKEEAEARGFRSLAILPLLVAEQVVGTIALYVGEAGFFDEEEMKLLQGLAADIAFALDHLEKKQKLDYLAYYDALTGLANRTLLLERLGQYLHVAKQSDAKVSLVLADIERFRSINESLGRQAGDALIKLVGERLTAAAGATEVGRVGADQFALIVSTVRGRSEAGRAVHRLWERCFVEPFRVGDAELRVSAKAGIAMFPSDGTDADTLLGNAEAAVRKAKASGDPHVFYVRALTERASETLTLENQLRLALEKEEFVLHYQPKIASETRGIVSAEALIRWQSPSLGLVPPGRFIPLLEETGLILQAGAWALRRAALDHRRWVEAKLAAPRVAVNVSSIQLRQKNFVETVEQAVLEGLAPTGIDLEITESLVMEDIQGNIEKLKRARALGMGVAIDDFGTGYSSLAYLARLPVTSLKIDRAFINSMLQEPENMMLVQTIISLAHSLRLKVVAEGVETEEQAKMLRLLRCDEMQGYLFSKPVPFEQFSALLTAKIA